MIFLIALINLVIVFLAWKQRQFSRLIFFVLFFPVITAQVIYIEIFKYEFIVPWHTFDFSLFSVAKFYVLASLFIVLCLGAFSPRKIKINHSKNREYYEEFYSTCFFILNFIFSSMFIFIFIGYSDVVEMSRPGIKAGTTIFLVFTISLTYPALVNLRNDFEIKFVDVINILLAILVCFVISKMHALAVALAAITIYLNRESKNSNRKLILVGLILFLLSASFVSLQYLKDKAFKAEKSDIDIILFTLQLIYLYGNEAFSGLFSAMSTSYRSPETTGLTFGVFQILNGIMKTIPSIIRPDLALDLLYFDPGQDERQSIVTSIYEETFRSFGMFGAIIYGAVLHFVLNYIDSQLKEQGPMMLAIILLLLLPFLLRGPMLVVVNHFIFLGCLIFFYQLFQSNRKRSF